MKKLFIKVWSWFSGLWKKTDNVVDKIIPVAVNVVQGVKKAIDTGNLDIVAEVAKKLIPGTVDDVIIDKAVEIAKKNIPRIAIQLDIIKNISEIEGTPEQMKEALFALKNVFGEKWEKFCTGMAQEIVVVMSDGDITTSEAWTLTKRYYDDFVKGK